MKATALALTAALTLGAGAALAAETQWGYAGAAGPEHWAALNPAYALCGQGMNQSPINLAGGIKAELEPIAFDYAGLVTAVQHAGQTAQADYTAGATITVQGRAFELKRIEFHAPSEHQINGKQFPLEAQFVHADADGNLAVLAVLYSYGNENGGIKRLWQQLPAKPGQKEGMASQVRADMLLPEKRDYYRANGSLTTPPCSEGVLWLILKQQGTASEAQVKQFTEIMGGLNNRPVQPLHARAVLQ